MKNNLKLIKKFKRGGYKFILVFDKDDELYYIICVDDGGIVASASNEDDVIYEFKEEFRYF